MNRSMPQFIDASAFLGLHSRNGTERTHSLSFFVDNLHYPIHMALEQVGLCDDLVWRYPRDIQDNYYPFMDCLHTDLDIRRTGYNHKDTVLAMTDPALNTLPTAKALLMSQVINNGGRIFTHDPDIRGSAALAKYLLPVAGRSGLQFPAALQALYRRSGVLSIAAVSHSSAPERPGGAPAALANGCVRRA